MELVRNYCFGNMVQSVFVKRAGGLVCEVSRLAIDIPIRQMFVLGGSCEVT